MKKQYKKVSCVGLFALGICFVFIFITGYFKSSNRVLDDAEIVELRREYPIVCESGLLSLAPAETLQTIVEAVPTYVQATIISEDSETHSSANSLEGGNTKEATFRNFLIKVDKVIYGDPTIENQTIIITINQLLPIPEMKEESKMILPLHKREDGKYDLLIYGAYYIVDDYVLSTYEENPESVYSGWRVNEFIDKLERLGRSTTSKE